jgi:hypothetical protein
MSAKRSAKAATPLLPFQPEPRARARSAITAESGPRPSEQFLLLRTLEIVQSIHGGSRLLTQGMQDIRANLPVQRRPLSKRAQQIMVTATRRHGLCPCCQETPVCTDSGQPLLNRQMVLPAVEEKAE